MKKLILTVAVIIWLFFLLVIGVYAFFWYSVLQMSIVQPIAQNVQITSQWQQIEITPSIKIKKQVQKISLKIEGYESKTDDSSFDTIKLSDGTIVNPEVLLIDENNKKYQFKDSSRTYNGSTTNSAEFSFDKKTNVIESLPQDTKYKAILIRSDKSFKCDISWIDSDLK